MIRKETKICLSVSGLHLALVVSTAVLISTIRDGQAPMLWVFFTYIDYPVSLTITLFTDEQYYEWFTSMNYPIPAMLFYPPYLVFGVLGTTWWYLLPMLFLKMLNAIRRIKAN
jgi:hypothetical protein